MTTSETGRRFRGRIRLGFTLIEVLVVISLMVIIVAALVANTLSVGQRAYVKATESLFQRIDLAMGTYHDREGFYVPDGLDADYLSREGVQIRGSACLYECLGRSMIIAKVGPGGRKVYERYSSPAIRFKDAELDKVPDDPMVAEIKDAWGTPIHYDRLEGDESYSMQDYPEIHLNPPDNHPPDPRELEGCVKKLGTGQHPGAFDLWSHGRFGHDVTPYGEEGDLQAAIKAIVCNWDKPPQE